VIVVSVVVYLIGVGSIVQEVPGSGMSVGNSISGGLVLAMILGACVVELVWQYARRCTWKARGLMIATAVAVAIVLVATPYRALIDRAYPAVASGAPPVVLTLGPPEPDPTRDQTARQGKRIVVTMPLQTTGVASGNVIVVEGTKFRITAADGTQWSSEWQSSGGSFWPDREGSAAATEVPRKFFDRATSEGSKVQISFALSVYREENLRGLQIPNGEFRVAGVGICSTGGWELELDCRSPLKRPNAIASINTSTQTCPVVRDKPAPPPATRITAESWNESSESAELGISPVRNSNLFFLNWRDLTDKFSRPGPCPGTPITFSTPVLAAKIRMDVAFEGVRLEDYARRFGNGHWEVGFGFDIRP